MQKLVFWGAVAAAAVTLTGVAEASGAVRSEARLASPTPEPIAATVAGVAWRCEADLCVGEGRRGLDSFMKECRKVAAALGPLAEFKSRGREMTGRSLAACNRAAGAAG